MERTDDAPRDALTIELKRDIFEKIARANGWTSNAEIAEALRISERQVSRIRSGQGRPGISFIAGLLNAAEETGFRRCFRVVPESEPIGKD